MEFKTNLEAAEYWYQFGYQVIPLNNDKQTVVKWKSWVNKLSKKSIRAYWKQHPTAQVGAILRPDQLILDADDAKGITALKRLTKKHTDGPVLIVKTKRGQHYHFHREADTVAHGRSSKTEDHPAALDVKTARTIDTGQTMVVLPDATGEKKILENGVASYEELAPVSQEFIDAIWKHNRWDKPKERVIDPDDIPSVPGGVDWDELLEALADLDPNCGYDDWLRVGQALHFESSGSELGYEVYDDWSAGGDSYAGSDDTRTKWESFTVEPGTGQVTGRSIFKMANPSKPTKKKKPKVKKGEDPVEAFYKALAVTDDMVKELKKTEIIYPGFVGSAHLAFWVGKPGHGKTAVAEHVAGYLASQGKRVAYLNMDAGGGDILDAQARANEGGYTLFSHDMHSGMSAQDTVDHLEALAQSDADLSDMVFFIDTLKKLVKVINKNDARAFYDTLRGLTARGAAVICLAHCNKYVDKETGFPIYEGTGDLESDADEVWLLFATHINEKKELLISSYSKSEVDYCKDRLPGKFLQTWKLNEKDRKVVRMDDWEDTVELKKQMATADEFESHIQVITQFIDKKGEVTQGEIEKWLDKKGVGLDRRRLSTLLESRKGQDWERVRKGRKLLHRPLSDDLDAIGAD